MSNQELIEYLRKTRGKPVVQVDLGQGHTTGVVVEKTDLIDQLKRCEVDNTLRVLHRSNNFIFLERT